MTSCNPERLVNDEQRFSVQRKQEGTTFAKFAVAFLRAFHETVDCIEADVSASALAQSASRWGWVERGRQEQGDRDRNRARSEGIRRDRG
eukprot:1174333-Rhodomonas_salina.2